LYIDRTCLANSVYRAEALAVASSTMETTMTQQKTALVLGATGGVGGEVARRLVARGWIVKALVRDPAKLAERTTGILAMKGDAMNAQDVAHAATGAALIVHAVNPSGYRDWEKLVLPMLENTISAARATGARILLPGTVYNYGPDAFSLIDEAAPQHPPTRMGAIRVEMEQRLRAATAQGVRTLIVRAGNFFGPKAGNNWFSQGLIKPGRPITAISDPGARGVGHQWAYLPDVAETMIQLAERTDLADFATFHMDGHWDADGKQMIEAIQRAVGAPVKVRAFPWWLVTLLAPFAPLFRGLREMRYLWRTPVRLDNARLVATLGREPHTPLDEAVRETLIGLECLPIEGRSA
jgi:nucleoside-diphosphate-sugar epimerase